MLLVFAALLRIAFSMMDAAMKAVAQPKVPDEGRSCPEQWEALQWVRGFAVH
jgi:hypothetical protein